MVEVDYG